MEMQIRGRTQREAVGEIEVQLVPERRERAGAGAVALLHALAQDAFHQVEILAHASDSGVQAANLALLRAAANRVSVSCTRKAARASVRTKPLKRLRPAGFCRRAAIVPARRLGTPLTTRPRRTPRRAAGGSSAAARARAGAPQ